MSLTSKTVRRLAAGAGVVLALALGIAAATAAESTVPPAVRQTIMARKATYILIATNFRPLADMLKGTNPFDAAEAQLRTARIAYLSDFLGEFYPDTTNVGEPETKAKPEVWTNRAEFDKKLKAFQADAAQLAKAASGPDSFKTAATALAQDCKGCHDDFRVK